MPSGFYVVGSRGKDPAVKQLMTANWAIGTPVEYPNVSGCARTRLDSKCADSNGSLLGRGRYAEVVSVAVGAARPIAVARLNA